MSDSQRERFMRRISTVGGGLREDIQMILGAMVVDLRELVIESEVDDADVDSVVALHDKVEALWRGSLASQPPLKAEELVVRIRELRQACRGPLTGFEVQLDRALDKAQTLHATKKLR